MPNEQNYSNHTRYFPLFHFVVIPLLLLNLIEHVVRIFTAANNDARLEQIMWAIFSFTLILLALAARLMVLTVQNRVIRLEEKLRYAGLLTSELNARCGSLTNAQIVALRFAPDDELPALVERTLNGDFAGTKDLKQAIKNWRGDHLRA
jgi:L-cystine uptake protein TcyP (sodium:dicarboxylate symporter family)